MPANVKRIYDPVHHFIELSHAEAKLLDSPVMQRLRRLRQLGLAYLAFPSAEHSRFSHALGALAMGTRAFDELARQGDELFAPGSDAAYQRRLLRAALLLHDVGHGPFSHACEAVLGIRHEDRTGAILALPDIRAHLADLEVEARDVSSLILGSRDGRYPVLEELVSGPNLDADRMDYLLRDAYFTGVSAGRYDADQLVASLRVFRVEDRAVLGIDRRGVVALESFVLARYMMFASVYFHHTTRMFERILQRALGELWPQPHALDEIGEFLRWDDFRVFNELRETQTEPARALRERIRLYALAAEFNAEGDLRVYSACERALRERYGNAVWSDEQSQLIHRLPLQIDAGAPTVWVGAAAGGVADAREASDVIAKLAGRAYWRKLFVERRRVDVSEARRICRGVTLQARNAENAANASPIHGRP
jgi:HD superfamily phosphohydrolase